MRRRTLLKGAAAAAALSHGGNVEGSQYTANPDAWQHFREGLRLYRTFLADETLQARRAFEQAIHLDPRFVRAHAMLSAAHRQDWVMGWALDAHYAEARAIGHANTAVQLAMREPEPKSSLSMALLQRGFVHCYAGRLEEAAADAEASIAHRPDFADGYALAAHILCYQVRPREALKTMNPSVARDPKYPFRYNYYTGHAYYLLGYLASNDNARRVAFNTAETHLRAALAPDDKGPNFRPASSFLVAALWELERFPEAIAQTRRQPRPEYLREPSALAAYINRTLPYTDAALRAHLIGLWQAADRGAEAVVA